MPLVDLKTDLKSLRFGKDRKGGGNSRQPYVQIGIPETPFEEALASPLGVKDFLLRGGLNTVTDTAEDLVRLGSFFTNPFNPSGLLFTAKQNLLSRTAVRTQTSGILNEGIYTPLSTLSQAGVNAFGGHLNKQGVNPFELTGAYSNNNNLYGVRVKPTQLKGNNRLVILKNLVDEGTSRTYSNGKILNEGGSNGVNILSYGGGPGSDLGIGRTNIRYADQRTGVNNKYAVGGKQGYFYGTPNAAGRRPYEPGNYIKSLSLKDLSLNSLNRTWTSVTKKFWELTDIYPENFITKDGQRPGYNLSVYNEEDPFNANIDKVTQNGSATLTGEQLLEQPTSQEEGYIVRQDFRKIIKENSKNDPKFNKAKENGTLSSAPSYRDKNIEQRVGLGDPGSIGGFNDRSDYEKGNPNSKGGLDKINSLYLYRSENVTTDPIKNDLCKFRIAVIDAEEPNKKTFIHFRAFIKSFSDNMTSTWNTFKYPGRGEDFYTYQGFNNNVNIDFTVAVQSVQELSPVYKKLNYLKSSLTPDYGTNGYMKGNIHQLTLGGYFYEVPGIIDSVNYTIPNESPWEIAIPSDNTEREAEGGITFRNPEVKELPLIVDVSISFKPIYDFLPQIVQNIDSGTKEKFISLASNNNTSLYDT